ncbi:radical SAM/SPASM domain-containing protein [Haliangium ochraceum]|uniref:Radical SAM domain protein n=1 Tax=Haliangium ochraceum (strain DSM 14365 / JCM 11303 / SMP-2) TaxID=502025 RepID=D0LLY8_HALO1|nr:radical SAM/SPASM domain-containing protein [Haliangium ochraceum]ACY15166.1 Radical SAM domain protein [Haliangium ochraceum DSM 14365]
MGIHLLTRIFKKRDYIAERELDDNLYLVSPDTLRAYRFQSAGKSVWEMLDGRRTSAELARAYCRSARVPYSDKLQDAISSFLETLRQQDLVYTDDEPGLRHKRACTRSGEGRLLSEPLEAGRDEDHSVLEELWQRASRNKIILKCDLALTYAYQPSSQPSGQTHPANGVRDHLSPLDTRAFLDLIDALADQGCLFLGLTGGELFVRPDAMLLAQHARARRFSIRILTNGTLIDEALADEIAALHPEAVEISLMGTCAETHERIARAPGSFAKITRACELLAEREVNVYARYLFTRANVYEALELPSLADALGVRYVYQKPHILPTPSAADAAPSPHLTDEQIQWLYLSDVWKPRGQSACYAGVSRCSISPSGAIQPCEYLPQSMGSLSAPMGLREMWLGSPQRELWDDARVHAPEECGACTIEDVCVRCPATAFRDSGDVRAPSATGCRVAGGLHATRRAVYSADRSGGQSWAEGLPFGRSPTPARRDQLVPLRVATKSKKGL